MLALKNKSNEYVHKLWYVLLKKHTQHASNSRAGGQVAEIANAKSEWLEKVVDSRVH